MFRRFAAQHRDVGSWLRFGHDGAPFRGNIGTVVPAISTDRDILYFAGFLDHEVCGCTTVPWFFAPVLAGTCREQVNCGCPKSLTPTTHKPRIGGAWRRIVRIVGVPVFLRPSFAKPLFYFSSQPSQTFFENESETIRHKSNLSFSLMNSTP